MPTLTIRNILDALYERLNQSVEAHRRSLNSEVLVCLEQSLQRPRRDAEQILARIPNVRKKASRCWLTDEILAEAKQQGRP